MLLAKLFYRLGVRLASLLGIYDVRGASYAGKALAYTKKLRCAGSLILDIGCGKGEISNLMMRLSKGMVVAVDTDVIILEFAKSKVCVVAADANHLPFRESSFNIVCAFHCLSM